MKYIFILLLISVLSAKAEDYVISGYVKDAQNGEALIGAKIYAKGTKIGVKSNAYGYYSLKLSEGKYTIEYSYIGYETDSLKIELNKDIRKDIELKTLSFDTEAITVTAEKVGVDIKSVEMSSIQLSAQTINKIPALLGEVDLVRSIQLLPGITTVGEGATGFNVRGGGIDQNLVLLDEAPVFNSSHLFGFFSVFNPDAVKDVKLVTGGIPANYGGRLSSILDVRAKEGNSKKLEMNGGIGLIFSRFAVEAPIVEDKASFIIAGRRSYIDVLAKPFLPDDLSDSRFYFYDLAAKVNWKIDDNNTVFASGYFGRDVFGAGFKFEWGNETATIRWNSIMSDNLFSNLTVFYSNYDYLLGFGEGNLDRFDWNSTIQNMSIKQDFNYFINPENELSFGAQAIYYTFQPGNAVGVSNGQKTDVSLAEKYALESAFYIDNEQKVNELLTLRYGLRYSFFNYLGKGTALEYGDAPRLGFSRPVVGFQQYDEWETIASYSLPEPRFSMSYLLDENSSVKLSYNRIAQYIHLISNTTAATPIDVWTPTTNNIKPQIGDQIAVGWFGDLFGTEYSLTVESYYKWMQNQIDYIDGADLLLNPFLEGDLLSGKGRAYGLELYFKKNRGDLTGWISLTLSRTERLVNGINRSDWFPTKFDRPLAMNTTILYKIDNEWEFSSNFVLNAGTPATFPTNRIELQGYIVPHNANELRNNYRIPWYHRLDLSFTYTSDNQKDDAWEDNWVFSIYNVYARRNPFSIFFQQNADMPGTTQAIRFAVLGTIVPAVSYNFKF